MLAYRAGEVAAFAALYARWRGPVYRYVLRQCRHAGQVDELYQEVFAKVIAAAPDYQPTARFATWLFRIAHNALVDHWRRERNVPQGFDLADDEAESPDAELPTAEIDWPDARAEQQQLRAALLAAIGDLPEVQREAFLLAEEGGLALEEIAQVTGVGRETVKSRLRYALGKLREQLRGWR